MLKKKLKKNLESENVFSFTQDLVPIKEIDSGFIITKGGDILKLIEIEPCDYANSPLEVRNSILNNFASIFECKPDNFHLKSVIKAQSPDELIRNVTNFKGEDNTFFSERKEDYIDIAKKMATQISLKRTYYLIFKLEDAKDKNNEINFDNLFKQTIEIVTRLENMGCSVNEQSINDNDYIASIYYSFFNPNTSQKESIFDRADRINMDYGMWNDNNPNDLKTTSLSDFLAPKGIDFTKRTDSFVLDGEYVSYLILKGQSIPASMTATLLNDITARYDIDYDIYSFRRNSEQVMQELKASERMKHISSNPNDNNSTDTTKSEETYGYYGTLNDIRRALIQKQHLFDVTIIFTFKNASVKALLEQKERFKSEFHNTPYYLDFRDCFCNLQELFLATLPLMEYKHTSSIFTLNQRNFITSSFRCLMPFNVREFIDNSGVVIGQNCYTQGMVTINNFNKAKGFQNYNIAMLGESGTGKTYAEMLICTRANLTGKRTFFICPIKGDEYKYICECSNGTFINLLPNGDCLNIFEIFAEDNSNESTNVSLLSQKITQVLTFLRLLYPNISVIQEGRLNVALIKIYKAKGFDERNNSSIYNADGTKKLSPTFTDLYEEIKNDEELKEVKDVIRAYFIEGTFKNLNAQTNVDLNKKCIAINCDEDVVGKKLVPCIMYLSFTVLYGLVKANRVSEDYLIIDECWKFLNDNHEDGTGEQLLSCAKTIRSYMGSLFVATQSISDFFNTTYGKQILDCCGTKIIKRLEGTRQSPTSHAYMVCNALGLSIDEYIDLITDGKTMTDRMGLLITPTQTVLISFLSSMFEKLLFGTDKITKKARNYLIENKGWGTKTFKVSDKDLEELYVKQIVDEHWLTV